MEHEQLGKYALISRIADGGMAEVYIAQTGGLGGFEKRVAVKKILPYFTRDKSFIESFINEARICGQLHHPNLVEVYEFNQQNDIYYLAMEYIDGLDLERILAHRRSRMEPFPVAVACSLMLQVLDGLDYAHSARNMDGIHMRVVHRDLKPSNILIDRSGVIKIVDFGIAKATSNIYQTRDLGTAKGTVGYMSPEQATGVADLTPASDLFSVGIIFYELLTLRRLFEGKNVFGILDAVRTADVQEKLAELKALPPGILKVLSKCLTRDPEKRYATGQEMAKDLKGSSPAGRGHDLLARFVIQLADQGLNPLHADFKQQTQHLKLSAPPPPDPQTPDFRTRLLPLEQASALLNSGEENPEDEEETGSLPPRLVEENYQEVTSQVPPRLPTPPPSAPPAPVAPAPVAPPPPPAAPPSPPPTPPGQPQASAAPNFAAPAQHNWSAPTPATWAGAAGASTMTTQPVPPEVQAAAASPGWAPSAPASEGGWNAQVTQNTAPPSQPGVSAWAPSTPQAPPSPARSASSARVWVLVAALLSLLALLGGLGWELIHRQKVVHVTVESDPPGAEVLRNGQRIPGQTPLSFTLSLDKPTYLDLTVEKQGYKTWHQPNLLVNPDDRSLPLYFSLEKALKVGSLYIETTPPQAKILLDGKDTGIVTPSAIKDVAVGPHTLTLKLEGFEVVETQVVVEVNIETQIARNLEPPASSAGSEP